MAFLIKEWYPEDPKFWQETGKAIARRNLWISIPALTLAFAIWMVWSVVVVNLPLVGFKFTTDELFWLAALPSLCGATLRVFYSFVVPIFGGRRWTAISTASLLIPSLGIAWAVQDPSTPYSIFIVLALLCGFGGANFASSMSNISFFYPKAQKGTALGLNAGLGNLGVSLMQFVVPLVIVNSLFGGAFGAPQTIIKNGETSFLWLQNAGLVWVPFILLTTLLAWFGMNDLASAQASFKDQSIIFKRKHNWLMCWLYLGTFGSFIGYSAGFPLLIKSQFPTVNALSYAWLGPLVGALTRPFGGWLADKLGGAFVTYWNFWLMVLGVVGVLYFLPVQQEGGNFMMFMGSFMVLFAAAGIGNGSTFRMIPIIFLTQHQRMAVNTPSLQDGITANANKEAAAVLGFSSAIGAYGGFFIPKSFGSSIAMTGGAEVALYGFIVFYLMCIGTTWWYYSRKNAEMPC